MDNKPMNQADEYMRNIFARMERELIRPTFPSIVSPILIGALGMAAFASIVAVNQTTVSNVALFGTALIGLWNAWQAKRIKAVAVATHTLSNSAMGAQLQSAVDDAKALSVVFHRISVDHPDDAAALAAATAADVKVEQRVKLLQAHLIQQAKVDEQVKA